MVTPSPTMYHLRLRKAIPNTPTWGFKMTSTGVNNGVNVQALLDAREALKATPEAAKFTWRASCKWQNGTHSESKVQSFFGLGQEQKHKKETSLGADHPEIFASEDHAITPIEYVLVGLASCLTAGVAAVAQNRGIQLRSVESNLEGKMDIRGILGIDSDVRNGYDDIKVTFKIDADASKEDIEAIVAQSQKRSAVYDVITNPVNVTVEVVLELAGRDHRTGHHGRHRRRAHGSGGEPMSQRALHRSRGARARRGRQLLASRALGLAPAADAQLAESTARASLRRPDPDGYMTMREVIDFISRFAVLSSAPVRTHTTVTRVQRTDAGYDVETNNGDLRCRTIMIASGACNVPSVPAVGKAVPPSIPSFTPFSYRNPNDLPEGGVLVVGASATGVQLADEIVRSGRPVTLSVGEHVRLPRTYRGRDVLWWMDASGVWNQRYTEVDDLMRVRRLPSPQLIGTPERATLDLNALGSAGVRDCRPSLRSARRTGVVLRWTAKSVCAGRLEDEPVARHVRRVGPEPRPRRRGRSSGTV